MPENPSRCWRSSLRRVVSGCRATGVAALLWGDMPDTQARGNLRQLLAATRRPAPFLEGDGGSIGFSAGMVETDLAAFEAAIVEDAPPALERAAALYRGDLLDGFSLRDRDFDEWLTGNASGCASTPCSFSCG